MNYRLFDVAKACGHTTPVVYGTPWEVYEVNGAEVHVKREDLCSPYPGPAFSKIRGLYAHLQKVKEREGNVPIGILDTIHSKAGWATAYIGNHLGLEVYDFYPLYKSNIGTGHITCQQKMSQSLGAILVPLKATAGYILKTVADTLLAQYTQGEGYMLPVGLKLPEAIESNANEVLDYTPDELIKEGTWVVSSSSGTIAASVWHALCAASSDAVMVCHSGYNRKEEKVRAYIEKMSGWIVDDDFFIYVDEGYAYKDKVKADCPFPCNPYYDLKAWKWMAEQDLKSWAQPIVFWNIGA